MLFSLFDDTSSSIENRIEAVNPGFTEFRPNKFKMPKLSYHLRWNNHLQNLQSLFENLYSEQSLVDVTISCSDGLLYAHKLVLSACSPYFEHIFKGNPCKHPILILRGIKRHDMQILLEYMYVGSVDVAEEDLEMLLSVATELQIKGLMQCPEEQSDALYQSINHEKTQSHHFSKDLKNRVNSPSPIPKNVDNLKWQAELVAQPTVSKIKDNVSRNDDHPDSSRALLRDENHQVQNQIHTIKSEPQEENQLGLEMYPSTLNEEQVVTKKEIPDECTFEELSMDYHQEEETIEKQSGTFEAAQNFLEKKPVDKDGADCFCHVCNRPFQNKVAYHRHMMTHSGIKPHRCTYCTQSFLRLSHLQRHIRVHTGERPYSCIKCPKQFSRSDKLRQHYLFQHNDSKINKMPKPRGRPRKHVELYAQPSASCHDPPHGNISSYPPLSIIPLSSNSV